MNKFTWMRAYFSPFKTIKIYLYIGKIAIGTPYFLPRKWIKSKNKPGYMTAISRKIGFNFVRLGWKTKWNRYDYRFEWRPIWSFVFFKWQIALLFIAPEEYHYWACWLCYYRDTDKSKPIKNRIAQCKELFPCIWNSYKDGIKIETDYYEKILKKKYLYHSDTFII